MTNTPETIEVDVEALIAKARQAEAYLIEQTPPDLRPDATNEPPFTLYGELAAALQASEAARLQVEKERDEARETAERLTGAWSEVDRLAAANQKAFSRAQASEEREAKLREALQQIADSGDAEVSAVRLFEGAQEIARAALRLSDPVEEAKEGGWRPIESAPEDFDETYFLVRPRGLHPARGTAFVPTVVTRLGDELFTAADHLSPMQWTKGDSVMNGPTSNIHEADLEWMPLPGGDT